MPPRKKKDPSTPSTMDELKDMLWKAADKLRGSLSAAQYKDVILGLVFLKYVSDAYEERRETIRRDLLADGYDEDQIADLIDDAEEYQGYGVFLVPAQARWQHLAENAKGKPAVGDEPGRTIGSLVDEAMDAIMNANESLRGTLPRLYNKDNIDQRRLGELIDLFNSMRFSRQGSHRARDLMGEVYEYFLAKFAAAEGKRGGEFFTPPSVVRTIVEVLDEMSGGEVSAKIHIYKAERELFIAHKMVLAVSDTFEAAESREEPNPGFIGLLEFLLNFCRTHLQNMVEQYQQACREANASPLDLLIKEGTYPDDHAGSKALMLDELIRESED
jgi:hypothetical protein